MSASPSGFTVTSPHGLIDAAGAVWNLIPVSGKGLVVACDGVLDTRTSNVLTLLFDKNVVYQENHQHNWWYWDATAPYPWISAPGDPRITAPPTSPTPPPTTGPTGGPTGPAGTGPAARSGFVVADFSQPQNYADGSTTHQVISPYSWGVSTGGAGDGACAAFADPNFRQAAATINPGLWRFNGGLGQRTDTPYFNGDGSVNPAGFANLIDNFAAVDPLGVSGVVMGINISGVPGFSDPNSYGNAMGNLARYLLGAKMSNGKAFPIIGFESDNEPGGLSPLTSYYNAMYSAVKGVSQNLLCFGPTTAWFGNLMPGFQQQVQGVDVIDYHSYAGGYSSNGPGQSCYQQNKGTDDINSLNLAMNPRAIFGGEYNIDWNCQCQEQHNYIGAIYAAVHIMQCHNGSPVEYWAAIWDARADGTCGVIDGNNTTIYPAGYFLGAAVRNVVGNRYQVTTNAAGLLTLAVSRGAGHASVMVVNHGQGNQSGESVAMSHWPVNANGNATANVWQLTSGNQNGSTSTTQVNAGVTGQLSFPDPSITIISV